MIKRGIAILTYNRANYLREHIQAIIDTSPEAAKIVVCDDGSTDATVEIVRTFPVTYIRGPNRGVAANKNRALYLLQDCHFVCLIEDDLFPQAKGWFEAYEKAAIHTNINHFCRVQEKEIPETHGEFTVWMQKELGLTPVYGSSPRGDLTFITAEVLREVGGLHPEFVGMGYAHGQWAERIDKAGLIGHPSKYIDIKEARDIFIQKGDTEGGRWNFPKSRTKEELKRNRNILKKVNAASEVYIPICLP